MSSTKNRFEINGYIDTNKSVLENIEELGTACNTWVTYDHNIGKWSIVINRAGTSSYSFNDANIIGGINVTETSFNDMYNSVEIQFPHRDLLDQRDWVRFDVPVLDRLPNEPTNRLVMSTSLTNDPVQAEQIALVELKQSRVNKIVEFVSDFTTLGLKAGDIIDITNTQYAWDQKLFRIVSIAEDDDADGNIVLSYTCLEYESDIYNYDLNRFERSRATGIKPQTINAEIEQSDDVDMGIDLGRLLALTGLTSLFNLGNSVNGSTGQNSVGLTSGECLQPTISTGGTQTICSNVAIPVTLSSTPKTISGCAVPANSEYTPVNYLISGVSSSDLDIPLSGPISALSNLTGTPTAGGKTATISYLDASNNVRATKTVNFNTGYNVAVSKTQSGNNLTFNITSDAPNGTNLSWSVSGTNLSSIYTGSTSGTVTVNSSGSATKNFTLTDNNTSSTATFVFTISGGNCGSANNTTSVPGGVAPPPADQTICSTVTIPLVYCPTFDGTTGALKSVSVTKTFTTYLDTVGGIPVPASVSVVGGAIVVNSTVNVAQPELGVPGVDAQVITAFSAVIGPGDPLITGSSFETVRGYFN